MGPHDGAAGPTRQVRRRSQDAPRSRWPCYPTAVTMAFPTVRPRRLRATPALRALVRETTLTPRQLVWPLFFNAAIDAASPIGTMPGVSQLPVKEAATRGPGSVARGLGAVILFGLPKTKDARGSSGLDPDGPVPRAVAAMKSAAPELVVMTDVCVDEYTDHGHCGILRTRRDGEHRGRQRRDPRGPRGDGARARARGGRRGRPERHDGRARRPHPPRARRERLRGDRAS